MKTICLYFQVHQPLRLRRYRFFDIGNDHYYYDDYTNERIMSRVSEQCYLPTNELLLKMIKKHKNKFKVTFSISGLAIEQFKLYSPKVLESFQELAKTGNVEFLAETYSHSLASLEDGVAFQTQVDAHLEMIEKYFGQKPSVFRNTELIYSDRIGELVANMGFKAMLTEGAKHILGWKSPNYVYTNAINPKLKVLLKNHKLSDDIAFKFGNKDWNEWPLTAEKFVGWINNMDEKEEIINLFIDYETFGEHQNADTGIFDFLEYLPVEVLKNKDYSFSTPSKIAKEIQPIAPVHVPDAISWADEERDLTAWLGNEMQQEAFGKLYALLPQIAMCTDDKILKDWDFLQTSDHFYYMSTKFFSDGEIHSYFNPYETPYEAFINYMNVLSDFALRLKAAVPKTDYDKQLSNLSETLKGREDKIKKLEAEIKKIRKKEVPAPKKTTKATTKAASEKSTTKTTTKKVATKKATPKKATKPTTKK